jgi:hypothetical protein
MRNAININSIKIVNVYMNFKFLFYNVLIKKKTRLQKKSKTLKIFMIVILTCKK